MSDQMEPLETRDISELPDEDKKIAEITWAAIQDERRHAAAELEAARLHDLERISPGCAREFEVELRDGNATTTVRLICGHKLNRHDPCSSCPCPGFRGVDGNDAKETGAVLRALHPDLFPASSRAADAVWDAFKKLTEGAA